ncbi:MAG: STAS domain-containing protein [Bacilli bacterium]|nr:STAS domain-containing protein [Bacilli bacterium]
MKHVFENNVLTIFLEGELNSSSSKAVEEEIDAILAANNPSKVVLDLKDLRYISSAGLRIIVRIKQRYDDTSLVNTPKPVYEIFKMVGFQNMIKIETL